MENNIEFLRRVVVTADKDYTLRKTAEECMELALVLIQQINKPSKNYVTHIEEEVAHVTMRLLMISELYNKDKIQEQFDWKVANMKRWEIEKGFTNL